MSYCNSVLCEADNNGKVKQTYPYLVFIPVPRDIILNIFLANGLTWCLVCMVCMVCMVCVYYSQALKVHIFSVFTLTARSSLRYSASYPTTSILIMLSQHFNILGVSWVRVQVISSQRSIPQLQSATNKRPQITHSVDMSAWY
jgi:hypothetical protein